MENDIAVKVDNVHKTFKIPHEKSSSLKSAALNAFKRKSFTEFPAAKGISFEVKRGEFFGIIGRNGSGKSTMLKMLAGIYLQDKGKIEVNGRLSPFLELGVGFNPELTARDNIYLNGAILGLTRKEIDEKFDEIIEFSELEEFVDQRLKNFSSGMQVRLAFSVAIHAHADILLIDEVLAVGDVNFQKKCYDVFKRFKKYGKTIVFVSHAMGQVKEFCDKAIVIEGGKVVFSGLPKEAVKIYNKLNLEKVDRTKSQIAVEGGVSYRAGNGKAVIEKITITNLLGVENKRFNEGEGIKIQVSYALKKKIDNLYFGFSLYHHERNQSIAGISKELNKDEKCIIVKIPRLQLNPGLYYLSFGLTDSSDNWMDPYDLIEKNSLIEIKPKDKEKTKEFVDFSIVNMPIEVSYEDK